MKARLDTQFKDTNFIPISKNGLLREAFETRLFLCSPYLYCQTQHPSVVDREPGTAVVEENVR